MATRLEMDLPGGNSPAGSIISCSDFRDVTMPVVYRRSGMEIGRTAVSCPEVGRASSGMEIPNTVTTLQGIDTKK